MALAETAQLAIELSLKDNFSANLKKARGALDGLGSATSNTRRSLGVTATNIVKLSRYAATGLIGLGGVSLKFAADFESDMNTINTIIRETPEALGEIGDELRDLSKRTGTPLKELTDGYYDLVSAGIEAADTQDVLTAANKLAIGGLASTVDTVDLLTTAINAYRFDASRASNIADIFAKSIDSGKVTAQELAESFARVAPLAAASGIEIEELAAGYAQLTAQGVPAAEASTQMRSAIVALQRPTKDMKKAQKELGVEFAEVAEEKGLQVAYQMIRKYAEETGTPLIQLLGRVEAQGYALAVTGEQAESYNKNLDEMSTASDGAGVAAEQMAERQKGLNFQIGRLREIGRDAAITLGERLLPKITSVAEALSNKLASPKVQRKIDEIADGIAGIFSDANLKRGGEIVERAFGALEDVPWKSIGEGMKIAGQATKSIVDGFLSLPPDVQKIAVAALAVNKVTGGLPTSIIKDLGGLALKSLKTITAANVTVIGGNVTGGGVGGPVGGGKVGGGKAGGIRGAVGGAAKVAGVVTVVGIGATVVAEITKPAAKDRERALNQEKATFEKIDSMFKELGNTNASIGEVNGAMVKINDKMATGLTFDQAANDYFRQIGLNTENASWNTDETRKLTQRMLDETMIGFDQMGLDLDQLKINTQKEFESSLTGFDQVGVDLNELRKTNEKEMNQQLRGFDQVGVSLDKIRDKATVIDGTLTKTGTQQLRELGLTKQEIGFVKRNVGNVGDKITSGNTKLDGLNQKQRDALVKLGLLPPELRNVKGAVNAGKDATKDVNRAVSTQTGVLRNKRFAVTVNTRVTNNVSGRAVALTGQKIDTWRGNLPL